ncbi:MAG: ribosomal L7Ae/L30e/S12e/Gadd45 family protein [Eubacteriales bacterium]|nr:ribosomal L7Ae/L30e/S12e/Gadd45 family protein [Eubacteriales bacterium]
MISISQKAGKAASGEFAAEKALKEGRGYLLILAEDASDNTRKKFENMADWREVPHCTYLSKTELGQIIGKGERSCVVITDENLAENIRRQLQ